ncbi:hypothetical protein ACFLYU_00920 [Candidatus Dependentiae bacterium]
MKKCIILSSILLLSCLAHANRQDEIANAHNPFEELATKFQDGRIKDSEIEKISATIKSNIDTAAEMCDSVVLTFKVKKDKNHDPQAWKEIVSLSADLIEQCKELPKREGDNQEVENILHKTSEFMLECTKRSGDETNIHGNFGISLGTPESHASVTYTN